MSEIPEYIFKKTVETKRSPGGTVMTSGNESYWHIIPKEETDQLLKEVLEKGWKKAIICSKSQNVRDLYLWTDCVSRADSTYYLPLSQNSYVLDLGSGWGSYTFALSPRVTSVIAADSCKESLEFIGLRAKQDGINNILPVHIEPLDKGSLPFKSGIFDSVIMNGVLEWVGSYLSKGSPLGMQVDCLREVFRTLKPGGALLIGIENRFGLQYFYGAPDDHLLHYSRDKKIAYTTILPRFIASLICRMKLGISYRTYTHSLLGLKRMLNKTGFRSIEFYFPVDGYRAITTKILPSDCMEARSIIRERIKGNIFRRTVEIFKLEKYICDSYFVIARK